MATDLVELFSRVRYLTEEAVPKELDYFLSKERIFDIRTCINEKVQDQLDENAQKGG